MIIKITNSKSMAQNDTLYTVQQSTKPCGSTKLNFLAIEWVVKKCLGTVFLYFILLLSLLSSHRCMRVHDKCKIVLAIPCHSIFFPTNYPQTCAQQFWTCSLQSCKVSGWLWCDPFKQSYQLGFFLATAYHWWKKVVCVLEKHRQSLTLLIAY